jgi:hypothetical protein
MTSWCFYHITWFSSLWFNYYFFIVAPLLTPFAIKGIFLYSECVMVNIYFKKKDEETNSIFSPIYYDDEE